jgi:hypothetical protein
MQRAYCPYAKSILYEPLQGDDKQRAAKERFFCRQIIEYFAEMLTVRGLNPNGAWYSVLPAKAGVVFCALFEVATAFLYKGESPAVLSEEEIFEELSSGFYAVAKRWNEAIARRRNI